MTEDEFKKEKDRINKLMKNPFIYPEGMKISVQCLICEEVIKLNAQSKRCIATCECENLHLTVYEDNAHYIAEGLIVENSLKIK